MKPKVLVTLSADQDNHFAQAVALMGGEPVICPLLQIEYLPVSFDSKPEAVLATSRHAFHQPLPTGWQDVPVYCVGEMTARAAKAKGLANIRHVTPDIHSLLPVIASAVETKFLYLRGADIAKDIKAALPQKDIAEYMTYKAVPVDTAEPFPEIHTVLLFSARAGNALRQIMQAQGLNTERINLLCLAGRVLDSVKDMGWRSVTIAESPDQAAMLAALRTLLRKDSHDDRLT